MRIAVLGLGSIGLRHARNLLASQHDVAGFDPDPECQAPLIEMGGAAVESREGALSGADAAVIASPNGYHFDDLTAAVEAGCHAFVEKPLAHTLDGVASLLDRAEARGLCVFVGFNLRFHPAVQATKKALIRGDIGPPLWAQFSAHSYLPDWRPGKDYRKGYAADPVSGGALLDFIHEFDLALHLLGPAQTLVAAARSTGSLGLSSEDCADAVLRHEGGVHSNIHVDYVTRPRSRVIEIGGNDGLLRADIERRRFTRLNIAGDPEEDTPFGTTFDDDYVAEMAAFLDCVKGEAAPPCDGRAGLAVLEQVIAARRLAGLPGS